VEASLIVDLDDNWERIVLERDDEIDDADPEIVDGGDKVPELMIRLETEESVDPEFPITEEETAD